MYHNGGVSDLGDMLVRDIEQTQEWSPSPHLDDFLAKIQTQWQDGCISPNGAGATTHQGHKRRMNLNSHTLGTDMLKTVYRIRCQMHNSKR